MSRQLLESADNLPPVMQLLIRELPLGQPIEEFYRTLRKLLPELRRQAEFSISEALQARREQKVAPPLALARLQ
jgi:hypothetical protein